MYTYKLWDGTSPINGVSANKIKEMYNISGAVYVIYNPEGKVQVFQPHKPDKEGFKSMTEREARRYAEAQVAELNASLTSEEVKSEQMESEEVAE